MNFNLDVPVLLETFLQKTEAKYYFNNKNYLIKRVITDSRKFDTEGGIFFAIKGKTFDGHNFINEIISKVDFVVLSQKLDVDSKYISKLIYVKDTTIALDTLANIYRNLFSELKIIAIVGSNGKTTTKEIIKSIFSKKYKVSATEKNFNNLLGVAYTLFQVKKNTQFCIVELGISFKGEMQLLGSTVEPDIVVLTNIGKEHLEFLEDTNTVFNEETQIIKYIRDKGLVIINKDDKYLSKLLVNKPKKYFSINSKSTDIFASDIVYDINITKFKIVIRTSIGVKLYFNIETKLFGIHNIYNILAAITTAFYCGIDDVEIIQQTISEFEGVEMRGKKYFVNNNIILDESYNANPDSMKTVIKEFFAVEREKVLVLGDMLELGKSSKVEHENLFNEIDLSKVKKIFLIGQEIRYLYKKISDKKNVVYCDTKEELLNEIKKLVYSQKNLIILFKASNHIGLSKIVLELISNNKI